MMMTVECVCSFCVFCFKQKTAYEMRISDWSSDVCSSDLLVDEVSPQRLTGMLFEGALTRLATARGAMARGETAAKLRAISGTVAIIEHLRGCLDMQAGDRKSTRLNSSH